MLPENSVPSTIDPNQFLQGQDVDAAQTLAALRPAIEPAPIPWWPPAIGWWVLAIALSAVAIFTAIYLYRRHQRYLATRYQREADDLLSRVTDDDNTAEQLQDIALILRRAAISAYGRERVGTVSWPELSALSPTPVLDEHCLTLLGEALYRKDIPSPDDMAHLLLHARRWLQQLPLHREKHS